MLAENLNLNVLHVYKEELCYVVSKAFWISKNPSPIDIALEDHVILKAHTLTCCAVTCTKVKMVCM